MLTMLTEAQEKTIIDAWVTTHDGIPLTQLIKAFEPLVLKYAHRFSRYGIPTEDLIAVGNLALVESAHLFDPTKGFKFSTYSSHWVRGTMLIFIASNYFSFAVKTKQMKKIFFNLRKLMYAEQKNSGVTDNTEEIMTKMATHFGCSSQEIEQIYQMIRHPNCSLNDPIRSSKQTDYEAGTIGDTISTNELDPEELLIEKSQNNYYQRIICSTMERVLNKRERAIIQGQLLQEDGNERTLQDLADEFDLSRERVRQIRNMAYEKLERAIRVRCGNEAHKVF